MNPRIRRLRKIKRIEAALAALISLDEDTPLVARSLRQLHYLVTLAKTAPLAKSLDQPTLIDLTPVLESHLTGSTLPAAPPVAVDLAPRVPTRCNHDDP